ncbi:unnamed protein product [Hymenolepis diminuta]|uniref:Enhancer of polycomb-like protein n=1 Tax=Hymenolepis diminuta TaxID=6216 RepID=A0A0R3SA55_HYMDI|nr:unnamed protein product [Hymenolepis diminuta]
MFDDESDTSTTLYGFWYTKLHKSKQPKIPRKNAPVFDFDWEHKRFRPTDANTSISEVEKLPEYTIVIRLTNEQKKVFTYGFNPVATDYSHQLKEFMASYGQHPADDSLLAKILHMSFRIQYNKYLLERAPRTFTLRGATESLVQRRMRLLRRLRALNKESYQKALEALKLNVHHLDPFDFGDSSEADVRKKKVKAECYQQRLARLARFKRDLVAKREEFYDKKEKDLSELVEKVSSLGLEKPDAEAKLRDLFKIVVEERQVETLSPTQVDKLQWYAKERVLRRHVINSILEREAQQLRARRK